MFGPTPLRFCCLILPFVLVVHASDAQPAAGSPATFRANSQIVLVPVTVTDHNGKTIEGLRADDFNILDDQKPQQIVSFSREDAPCSIGLVLDVSGSMQKALGAVKDVVRAFLSTANPDDEFLLSTVSTQPAAMPEFTTDVAALEKSIESITPGGMTALIDTAYLSLSRMRAARRPRRALLILSDGIDNYSRYSETELMGVALEADVQVYTIIVDNGLPGSSGGSVPFRPAMASKPWDRGPARQGPEMLEKLADKTGGLHFRARGAAETNQALIKAGQAIRDEYVIGYRPADASSAGRWHRIRVKANVPRVDIHSRNGYYAP